MSSPNSYDFYQIGIDIANLSSSLDSEFLGLLRLISSIQSDLKLQRISKASKKMDKLYKKVNGLYWRI